MSDKLKLPLPNEIVKARIECADIYGDTDTGYVMRVMSCWEGEYWHKSEIYFGILIGLQIAKGRIKGACK
jgi:hypothetical protein